MFFAVAQTNAAAVVSRTLDYCNSFYHNIALKNILRLHNCVQNCLARVAARSPRFSHSASLLKSLHWLPVRYHWLPVRYHWLPVQYRVILKICAITYQALSPKQVYIHCSLLQGSPDRYHLILIYFLFPVLRQISELELF